MKPVLTCLLVVLAGCGGEHVRAARAVDCQGDMRNISRLTKAELRELQAAEQINAEGRAGREVANVVGSVVATLVLQRPVLTGSSDLVPKPQVGWPHVWVGCQEVALCQPNETCARGARLQVEVRDADNDELLDRCEVELKIDLEEWD